MHKSTATKQVSPPDTIDVMLEEIDATSPARAFPSSGPLM
jgi:hypothetical protein